MKPQSNSRRDFMRKGLASSALISAGISNPLLANNMTSEVTVLNPRNRVPVSFIIDDSTALVNMAYYGIPQFAEVFPQQYLQDWKKLPREIPDDFVREFRDWCGENGVKGKYSMVPFPACTGWLHRFIPGWSKTDLEESLKLVRDTMTPNWDIHPEMISHTRVINTKTGLPYPYAKPEYMENWEWSQTKSADELADYIGYALNVLKEAGFYCEGITTPGGFGSKNMENLALGTLEAQKEVYKTEVPHFFRNLYTDPEKSVEPELFHVSGIGTDDPRCSVHPRHSPRVRRNASSGSRPHPGNIFTSIGLSSVQWKSGNAYRSQREERGAALSWLLKFPEVSLHSKDRCPCPAPVADQC